MADFKQLTGSVKASQIDLSGASTSDHGATRGYVDLAVTASAMNAQHKNPVRAATTANITLSGAQTIDGVSVIAGERVLVKNQSAGADNGIYLCASGSWTRATDFDTSGEVKGGCLIPVSEGTANGDKIFQLTTNDPIVLATTALVFTAFSSTYYATPTLSNKDMTCLATTTDFDSACNTGLSDTPATSSYVQVFINGIKYTVGDAVKTKHCYFSADTGTTAKALNALASGDKLYWVGSVAGFQLATTDRLDFDYAV